MAKFNRLVVAKQMASAGVVPLFFHDDLSTAKKVLSACYDGGSRLLEFTNRGEQAHEIFTDLVSYVRSELPEMMIGAGSIIDAETTALFLQSGADFIVSPILDEEMAHTCHKQNVLWSPGCGTLTEAVHGYKLGAEILKIFPASSLGPGFIKAVKGPCPWLKLMPTGGVSPDNISAWIDAGATCVGMGSKLIKKDFLQEKKFSALQQHVSSILKQAKSIQKNN